MTTQQKLYGKRALVTGSGTGIGREVALEFARQGADVVVHYSHSDTGAKSAAEEIIAMGRKSTAFKADFGDLDEVVAMAAFLCSDEAGFIVGQTIVADGGTTSLMSLISDFRNEYASSLGVGYVPGI